MLESVFQAQNGDGRVEVLDDLETLLAEEVEPVLDAVFGTHTHVGTAASHAGVAKADTLYIGDSGVDMETARRACIDSVGVTWGFRSKKELVEYYADVIVNNPVEILDIVENGIKIS